MISTAELKCPPTKPESLQIFTYFISKFSNKSISHCVLLYITVLINKPIPLRNLAALFYSSN